MKLKAYIDAIQQSEKDETAQMAPARAAETKAKLGMKAAELSIAILRQENCVAEVSARYPLDIQTLSNALDDLTLLRLSASQLENVTKQLFPA
jgi:hypothetical protein